MSQPPQSAYQGQPAVPQPSEGADHVENQFAPDPEPVPQHAKPDRKATAPGTPRWLTIVLVVLLILTLAVTGYLIHLSRSWSAQSEKLDGISQDLGEQVSQLQTELNTTTANLEVAEDQLFKSQKRITELASEKALVGDDRENQRILAEDTAQVASEALTVSSQLGDCVTAQSALATEIGGAQSTQNKIIRELALDEPDLEVIDTLNEELAATNTKISDQQKATTDTCEPAVDRYNSLLSDLDQS